MKQTTNKLTEKTKYVIYLFHFSKGFQHEAVDRDWTCHKCKKSREVDMIQCDTCDNWFDWKEKIECQDYLLFIKL